MMIIAVCSLAMASGWRPIACRAPLPIMPRPMPEPTAARPMPSGIAKDSAKRKSMGLLLGFLVMVLRFRLVPVVVRQHEEEVDRAEDAEDERLDEAGQEREEQEREVQRQAEVQEAEAQQREQADPESGEAHQQHVLAEDVAEESAR